MLKDLKKLLESEKHDKRIFELVIYGSILRNNSKPKDVDIAVIFLEGTLRERLDKIQEIKNKLKTLNLNLDIKQVLLKDFFAPEFLARTGILTEGYAVFNKKNFCETLGFRAYTIFTYALEGLNHTQKVKFNFILSGRNGEGMLEKMNAVRLAGGVIKVPINNALTAETILKNNNVKFSRKNVLEEM
ncbi:MAG: nucleotidyltransferase domain-containing protein [Candidatus Nanoarchaeia archaeon]